MLPEGLWLRHRISICQKVSTDFQENLLNFQLYVIKLRKKRCKRDSDVFCFGLKLHSWCKRSSDEKHRLWKVACNDDALRIGPDSNLDTFGVRKRNEGWRVGQERRGGNRYIYCVLRQFRTYWTPAYFCSTLLIWTKVIVIISLQCKATFQQWNWCFVQLYYAWWQWHGATIEYVLNVLAQVVVAGSCCCGAYNGSDFLHSSKLSRLESCTVIGDGHN
jgi:hypothetical protein